MATSSSQSRNAPAKNRNVSANLRGAIPLTKQTDPNEFPAYEHIEYPKMMLQEGGKPYIDAASNEPIVVLDPDEEREFRAENPEALDIANVQHGSALSRAEREELEALRALKRETSGETADDGEEPKTAPNRLAGVTRPASSHRLKGKDGERLPAKLD